MYNDFDRWFKLLNSKDTLSLSERKDLISFLEDLRSEISKLEKIKALSSSEDSERGMSLGCGGFSRW